MIRSMVMIAFIVIISIHSYSEDATRVTWEMMKAFNFETGEIPDSLQQYDNQIIEIAGFIVPLEMDEYLDKVTEFFLVPDPMACIHVPPPPPNQMIYVKMAESIPLDMDYRGIAITGTLTIPDTTDGNAFFGFEIEGISAKEEEVYYEDPLYELFLD